MLDDSATPPRFNLERDADNVRARVWWSEYWYVSRRLEELVRHLVCLAAPSPTSTVVDLGCADQPYRELGGNARYLGVDLPGNPLADVVLDQDGSVPLENAVADLVLSTQVLEHVQSPEAYLAEAHRLLKPGGHLVVTTHGIMVYHPDPADHWRWTGEGLRLLVQRAGFRVDELRGIVGLEASAIQLLQTGLIRRAPRGTRKLVAFSFQRFVALLDRLSTESSRKDDALVLGILATRV